MRIGADRASTALAAITLIGCASRQPAEAFPRAPMGMDQVLIDAITNDPEEKTHLRVSGDGRRLLFNIVSGRQRQRSLLQRLLISADDPARAYWTTAVAMMEIGRPGRNIVSQEGARDAAWYPDGSQFTFSMLQGDQAMLASSKFGHEAAAVRFLAPTPCIAFDWQPSVYPDGRSVLFSTFTADEPQTLAVMDLGRVLRNARCSSRGRTLSGVHRGAVSSLPASSTALIRSSRMTRRRCSTFSSPSARSRSWPRRSRS